MPGTGQSALSGGEGGGRAVGSVPDQHRRGEGLASRVPSRQQLCMHCCHPLPVFSSVVPVGVRVPKPRGLGEWSGLTVGLTDGPEM